MSVSRVTTVTVQFSILLLAITASFHFHAAANTAYTAEKQNELAQQNKLFAKMAASLETLCNNYCQDEGYGNGKVRGTAPFCGASCSGDCNSDHCIAGPAGVCITGNKICCCDREFKNSSAQCWFVCHSVGLYSCLSLSGYHACRPLHFTRHCVVTILIEVSYALIIILSYHAFRLRCHHG